MYDNLLVLWVCKYINSVAVTYSSGLPVPLKARVNIRRTRYNYDALLPNMKLYNYSDWHECGYCK